MDVLVLCANRDFDRALAPIEGRSDTTVPVNCCDRLRELGVSQRGVQTERDGWILLQSASPKAAAIWFADKLDAIDDPEFVALYLEYDAAFDWSPDDPRLVALAGRAQRWIASQSGRLKRGKRSIPAPTVAKLVATSAGASSPAWDRLSEIGKERIG